jgi:hypothetical protein
MLDCISCLTSNLVQLGIFFHEQMPACISCFQQVLPEFYPTVAHNQSELDLTQFMHMLYVVSCRAPGSTIQGKYMVREEAPSLGIGSQGSLWNQLKEAFQVLQDDFKNFDTNGDGLVDYTEISMGIPPTKCNQERLAILTRLEHAFQTVDLDQSRSLDFFEYMYLGFQLTQSSSYFELVPQTQGASQVKKCFLEINKHYR